MIVKDEVKIKEMKEIAKNISKGTVGGDVLVELHEKNKLFDFIEYVYFNEKKLKYENNKLMDKIFEALVLFCSDIGDRPLMKKYFFENENYSDIFNREIKSERIYSFLKTLSEISAYVTYFLTWVIYNIDENVIISTLLDGNLKEQFNSFLFPILDDDKKIKEKISENLLSKMLESYSSSSNLSKILVRDIEKFFAEMKSLEGINIEFDRILNSNSLSDKVLKEIKNGKSSYLMDYFKDGKIFFFIKEIIDNIGEDKAMSQIDLLYRWGIEGVIDITPEIVLSLNFQNTSKDFNDFTKYKFLSDIIEDLFIVQKASEKKWKRLFYSFPTSVILYFIDKTDMDMGIFIFKNIMEKVFIKDMKKIMKYTNGDDFIEVDRFLNFFMYLDSTREYFVETFKNDFSIFYKICDFFTMIEDIDYLNDEWYQPYNSINAFDELRYQEYFRILRLINTFDGVIQEGNIEDEEILNQKKVTHDIILTLEKHERDNRIEKVLYKGEPREKGKIYADTIQKYLKDIKNSSKIYDVIEGRKVLRDLTKEMSAKIEYLEELNKTANKNDFIESNDSLEKKDDINYGNAQEFSEPEIIINWIQKNGKPLINISPSQYIGHNMQNLLVNDIQHNVFNVYLDNTSDLLDYLEHDLEYKSTARIISASTRDTIHQRDMNGRFMMGFIRYHYFENQIWIDTIQSDISFYFIVKHRDEDYTVELYKKLCVMCMRYFIIAMHKKGFTNISIPTSKSRGELFGKTNAGLVSINDEIPKLFGFKKVKMIDTIWYDQVLEYEGEGLEINFDKLEKISIWNLEGLNESFIKKNQKHINEMAIKIPLSVNKAVDFIVESIFNIGKKFNISKVEFDNMNKSLKKFIKDNVYYFSTRENNDMIEWEKLNDKNISEKYGKNIKIIRKNNINFELKKMKKTCVIVSNFIYISLTEFNKITIIINDDFNEVFKKDYNYIMENTISNLKTDEDYKTFFQDDDVILDKFYIERIFSKNISNEIYKLLKKEELFKNVNLDFKILLSGEQKNDNESNKVFLSAYYLPLEGNNNEIGIEVYSLENLKNIHHDSNNTSSLKRDFRETLQHEFIHFIDYLTQAKNQDISVYSSSIKRHRWHGYEKNEKEQIVLTPDGEFKNSLYIYSDTEIQAYCHNISSFLISYIFSNFKMEDILMIKNDIKNNITKYIKIIIDLYPSKTSRWDIKWLKHHYDNKDIKKIPVNIVNIERYREFNMFVEKPETKRKLVDGRKEWKRIKQYISEQIKYFFDDYQDEDYQSYYEIYYDSALLK